jgi:hypothetical protein
LLCCNFAQSQTMNLQILSGKWMLLDSTTTQTLTYNFIDSQRVELLFEGNRLSANYSISAKEDKAILTIHLDNGKTQEFVILEKTPDKLELCFPKDYERAIQAKQYRKDKISWGWDNPIIVWQKKKPD